MRAKITVFEGKDGLWYYNVKAANGEIVSTSEGYVSRSNAERAVERLPAIIGSLDVTTQEIPVAEQDGDGEA